MTQIFAQPFYSRKEYLEVEAASEKRHEYVDGQIRSIVEENSDHQAIANTLSAILKRSLRGHPYQVFAMNQRLWIPHRNFYTYPDVMVIKKPLQLQTGWIDIVMNPCLIVEVLSKATQDYDRGTKFSAYRTIPSFCEYLLIDQQSFYVEHYVKVAANQWLLSEYNDPNTILSFVSLEAQLKIVALYENIDFNYYSKPE